MSNATNYVWSDGDNSPIKTFNTIGAFQLLIANDCEERALNFLVEKSDCCNFYAPNAFSPNQDGQNDAFNIFFNPNGCDVITNFSLAIFDRWGGIVFETSEVDFKWDGKNRDRILLPGVYVWRMTYGDNQNPQIAFGELLLVK
jgi:gliding motility-associated-like protein